MRSKSVLSMLLMTALLLTFAFTNAEAGLPGLPGILIPPGLPGSSVDVRIQGYVPAPPGVNVRIDAGRPYYVQRDRVVYMERERPVEHRHYKKHRKHRRHHDERDHRHYDKHDRHEGRGGHGR